jgi:tetratricopeptide (TPR) repeat protein
MKKKAFFDHLFCGILILIFVSGHASLAPAQTEASGKTEPAGGQTAKTLSPGKEKDADYWFSQGALVATYGNNKAAIRYFQKALSLNPNHSGAYFEQGISYGQLGNYQRAILLIDRALELEPQNGIYFYGRGRVYLLSGDKNRAMEDIKRAAELGDEDALNYLDYIGRR